MKEIAPERPPERKRPFLVGAGEPAITDDIRRFCLARCLALRSARQARGQSKHSARGAAIAAGLARFAGTTAPGRLSTVYGAEPRGPLTVEGGHHWALRGMPQKGGRPSLTERQERGEYRA